MSINEYYFVNLFGEDIYFKFLREQFDGMLVGSIIKSDNISLTGLEVAFMKVRCDKVTDTKKINELDKLLTFQ